MKLIDLKTTCIVYHTVWRRPSPGKVRGAHSVVRVGKAVTSVTTKPSNSPNPSSAIGCLAYVGPTIQWRV